MKVRRLEREEHGNTRPLWEEVFPEDTKAFLDYYYCIKAKDNQIYVVEEDDRICSMLQLNPYRLKIEEGDFPSAYIIAVATQEAYRGRGFMGALLRRALEDMYLAKIPFTFLMPAAEAIYTPYDFRFIYSQYNGMLDISSGMGSRADAAGGDVRDEKTDVGDTVVSSDAALWNSGEMSDFFNRYFAGRWQVFAVRDAAYYQTMIMEQQSEKGGVRLMRDDGRITGMYAYAAEDGLEIREPLYLPGYQEAFRHSVCELAEQIKLTSRDFQADHKVKIYACPENMRTDEKPAIMARVVCLPELFGALRTREDSSVDCSFAVIDPLICRNSRVWRLISRPGMEEIEVRETEDSEGMIPVDVLTEFLFGRISARELQESDTAIVNEHLAGELAKITKLTKIFLNEIV